MRKNIMTNEELLEIHFNNSDLNITNLAAINNSSVEVVRDILVEYYNNKSWAPPCITR